MDMTYEKELSPLLEKSGDEILEYGRKLTDEQPPQWHKRYLELCEMLRENRRTEEAKRLAGIQYEKWPSRATLALYLLNSVEDGDKILTRKLCGEAERLLREEPDNASDTLMQVCLWAADELEDDALFENFFSMVPEWDKTSNKNVVYHIFRHYQKKGESEKIWRHYRMLNEEVRQDRYIKRYYEMALEQMEKKPKKRVFLVGEPSATSRMVEALLRSNRIPYYNLSREMRPGGTLAETLERYAPDNDYGIVMLSPKEMGENGKWYPSMNEVFVYGYFMSKLGKRNVCLLECTDGKRMALPGDYAAAAVIRVERADWVDEFADALRKAGFDVNF